MKVIALVVVLACLAAVSADPNPPCSRVGGYLRHADGRFCTECVLTKGFYRTNKGQFCAGSCEIISRNPIVRKDSITNEICLPCDKKDARGNYHTADGKFCKQECIRDGWYPGDKTESYRDTVTGQYCKPAAHGTKATPTQAQLAHRFVSGRDPQKPSSDTGHHSPGLNAGSCTLFGGALRTPEGKFCSHQCTLEDGFFRNTKTGEFCIRPCANNKSMTGATCEDCKVDPKNKNIFRTTHSKKFCEQICLRDGWLRPGVPLFRDPVTGRFCKNKN